MGSYKKRPGTTPVNAPYTLDEDRGGRDAPQMARLYEESIGYPNLANDPFVVEQAKAAVKTGLKDVFNTLEFLRNKWLILYRLYRGESLVQYQYGRNQLHSPEPFKAVETVHPRVMRALFGNERWFKLYGLHDDGDEAAIAQEILCRDQFRSMDFLTSASDFVRDGLIYGTAIQKVYWKQDVDEMTYRTAQKVEDPERSGVPRKKLSETKRTEIVFDGNFVKNVSIFDFFTSPNVGTVDEAEWCADRSMMPDWRVKQMGELGHWINLNPLRDHAGTQDTSFGDEFKERKSYSYGIFDPRQAAQAPHIPHYMVFDWYGPLVIRDNNGSLTTKICNVVMIEPDGPEIIARVTELPFWHKRKPYQSWRVTNLQDEFFGIGILEPIARLSMEKDMKRNLLMAATQLEANPMWMVSDDANIPDGQLILEPGSVVRVPNIENSIAPLHMPKVSDSALKAENVLTMDLRETAGTTSPSMGALDPFGSSGKTATQHTSEVDEAKQRMIGMIENYERQVVLPMINQMVWNNQQFISYDKVVRELGAIGMRYHDRYEIRPEDLIGRFLVQPLAGQRLLVKQTQVQQLANILDRAPVINQMYGPNAVKMPKLLAMILEVGFDIRNVDDYIGVPADEAGLLTAMEEHELWYYGKVPGRRPDDNDLRHIKAHEKEIGSDRFAQLAIREPGTAARAQAHLASHMQKVTMLQEAQEGDMMRAAQMGNMMALGQGNDVGGGGQNGQSPVDGAGGPNQEADSPKVRRNENEREGGQNAEAQRGAPNPGAQ